MILWPMEKESFYGRNTKQKPMDPTLSSVINKGKADFWVKLKISTTIKEFKDANMLIPINFYSNSC